MKRKRKTKRLAWSFFCGEDEGTGEPSAGAVCPLETMLLSARKYNMLHFAFGSGAWLLPKRRVGGAAARCQDWKMEPSAISCMGVKRGEAPFVGSRGNPCEKPLYGPAKLVRTKVALSPLVRGLISKSFVYGDMCHILT